MYHPLQPLLQTGIETHIAVTGLGMTFAGLFNVPGLSSFLGSYHIPYGKDAMKVFLQGREVVKSVSFDTAQKMLDTMVSMYQTGDTRCRVFLAVTGAGPTVEPRRGLDQVYVSGRLYPTSGGYLEYNHRMVFKKGCHIRTGVEAIAVEEMIQALYTLSEECTPINTPYENVYSSRFTVDGTIDRSFTTKDLKWDPNDYMFIPITGNPVHQGHLAMADYAYSCGRIPLFCVSSVHHIKGAISPFDVQERILSIPKAACPDPDFLWVDKWTHNPGRVWLMGTDAWELLWSYGTPHDVIEAVIRDTGTRIHVSYRDGKTPVTRLDLIERVAAMDVSMSSSAIRTEYGL
jgi:hypothetical protein